MTCIIAFAVNFENGCFPTNFPTNERHGQYGWELPGTSRYLGADTICITILYALRFNTAIFLRFDVPNIFLTRLSAVERQRRACLISQVNKSVENMLAHYLKRRWKINDRMKNTRVLTQA
jgi:hypothetical protein